MDAHLVACPQCKQFHIYTGNGERIRCGNCSKTYSIRGNTYAKGTVEEAKAKLDELRRK